jgi:exosortase D (VPLPA-CTERM-specific)
MYHQWTTNEDFSHGVLIVPIVFYLIWEKRNKLTSLSPVIDWCGMVMMFAAIFIYIIGELGAEIFTTRFAVLCLCIGATWLLYGKAVLRELAFPLAVLFLMLPLPGFIYRNLTFSLQLLTSIISVELLNGIGFLAFREGNVIDMGFGKFQVVDACNGLRFIMPMLTLGVLFAFMRPQVWWKRLVLVASTIPLAMATNILRIVGTGILARFFGIGVAQGFFHDFSGWAVFMVSLALFGLLSLVLKRLPGKPKVRSSQAQTRVHLGYDLKKRILVSGAAFTVCLVSPLVVNVLGNVEPVPLKKSLDQFPVEIDGRIGKHSTMDESIWEKVGAQSYVLINYQKKGEPGINFYTAHYEYQRKAGDFIHSPKLCLPGEGWFIESNDTRYIERSASDEEFPVLRFNELIIERRGERRLVYFWYQGRNRNFTSEYMAKFYMVWDGVMHRRTDGALVRLVMPLPPEMPVEVGRRNLDRFAKNTSLELANYLP